MTKKDRELCDAVDMFASAMKQRLIDKRKARWHGWDSPHNFDVASRMLNKAARVFALAREASMKDCVDIANFAMFLWTYAYKEKKETES